MTLSLYDEFAGAGGSSQGASAVPGVELIFAANHNPQAIASHAANFPGVEHFEGDVARANIETFPAADLFWASPSCPPWSNARGKRRDFDHSTQGVLFGEVEPDPATKRARALMEEVPRYLAAMIRRGRPVLAGVVENVTECRNWDQWQRWIGEIRALGYRTRTIALNSMHATPVRTRRASQSRDRLYVAYWRETLGRQPDWDKWLRPSAWCPTCDQVVAALQVFKRPGADMGRYGRTGQYVYRCPNVKCRNQVVHPQTAPAADIIDWSLPGTRIGDRPEPLADATMERIRIGLQRFTVPVLVPTEGRSGKVAAPVQLPMRTQTARNETGLAWTPYIVPLRGGGDRGRARPVTDPLTTVTASGNHHGLVTAPNSRIEQLLIPYYSTGTARSVAEPVGTITTRDRWSLVTAEVPVLDLDDLDDVRFRMLEPHEIGAAMAFGQDYIVLGSKRDRVRQYGNAVTPPAAEVLMSALVEAVTGEQLERAA